MANRMVLESRWDEAKGRVKEVWGSLTDDELRQSEGRWDQLVAMIRRKTGETVEAIERRLDDIIDRLD